MLNTLGPYTNALNYIISVAEESRMDFDTDALPTDSPTSLYRGIHLRKDQIKPFSDKIDK